ncbi:hypothetical protein CEP53_002404 [Fusarium sp. AF-6]|nr:hypothetical protein CEP53_002404 [Fusarium sp. AF-6]
MSNFLMLSQAPAAMDRREPSTNSGILGGGGSPIEIEPFQSTSGNMPTPSRALQTRYIELVFGSDVTLGGNPGLHAYFRHMEDSFEPLLDASFAPVWDAFGLPRPRSTHDCWPLPVAVFEAIQRQTREPQDVSIDVIIEAMLSACGCTVPSNRSFCQVAVFAVLCWSTMILTPDLQPQAPQPQLVCHLSRRFESDKLVQQTLDRCRRSISATFRGFKAQAWGRDVMQVAQHDSGTSEDLHKSALNYRSLQMFGKIRIQWVTSMAAHLEFDPASRHLSVFRFPTICALRSMQDRKSQRRVLRSICEEFDPLPAEDIVHRYTTLEQEILLSYRLLFAQSSASRKRIGAEINNLRQDGQFVDDFLSTLCERKCRTGMLWWSRMDDQLRQLPPELWPISCRDSEQHLQERDVYSAMEDFPRLGQRLLQVQKFNLRQQPSKLADLWRDRRNPLQWYTFWAVLIIGGMANVVGVLQLAVAIYQAVAGKG